MIEMLSGHLGSGSWAVKQQDGCYFLSHRLAFSPKSEYRIGADEILNVQVEEISGEQRRISLQLTDERFAQALVNEQELETLLNLVNLDTPAPEAKDTQQLWVKGLIVFFIIIFLIEFLR